ncbi:unnamed protein product [Heligmosomoides polygyrus]|uniref:Uncharacterized protein n=1 Tax=Heligmosomoides polygyrus TaxID=6339 RepID=A0A183FG88_HELPZ|nr:unnamed protein product [Heligmosomoides polygyrus]
MTVKTPPASWAETRETIEDNAGTTTGGAPSELSLHPTTYTSGECRRASDVKVHVSVTWSDTEDCERERCGEVQAEED